MPYIKMEDRAKYDLAIEDLATRIFSNCESPEDAAGVLNYCITQLISESFARLAPKTRYWHVALLCGMLDNVKTEFYRRKAVPYEDQKIAENGDVKAYE